MSAPGFDWLNIPGMEGEKTGNATPPPPVSFGVSPTSSSSSLNTKPSEPSHLKFDSLFEKLSSSVHLASDRRVHSADAIDQLKTPEVTTPPESNNIDLKNDDESIPLSLTADQLSSEEAKTYLRWYNDMLTRRGSKTVTLDDVFQFMNNFGIMPKLKRVLQNLFAQFAKSLNIGQFFALLRIVAHCLQGQQPARRLIKLQAPIPKPVSILSRKRLKEEETEEEDMEPVQESNSQEKLDINSFTAFMLTGKRPEEEQSPVKKKGNKKRVKFSDQVVTAVGTVEDPPSSPSLDWSLPMEQLLGKMQRDENEEEELKDMQDSINHFQNVNIDSVSIHGTPSNIPSAFFDQNGNLSPQVDPALQSPDKKQSGYFDYQHPLATQSTGQIVNPQVSATPAIVTQLTGGPVLSTSSLPIQTTGGNGLLSPPPPPPRHRSTSSPVPFAGFSAAPVVSSPLVQNEILAPIATGSSSRPISPAAPPPPPPRSRASTVGSKLNPPPPPPRARKTSSPPPYQGNGESILGDLQALRAEVDKIKAMGIQN